MAFVRGFKTRCEKIASGLRKDLTIESHEALVIEDAAGHLGASLIPHDRIPGLSEEALTALRKDRGDWSAVTIAADDAHFIVYNSTSSEARTASDVAHELSHLILRHDPSTLAFAPDGTWAFRTYDPQQEEEAAWLSGCLLLPRVALLSIARSGMSDADACLSYTVSSALLRYRRNATGVSRQMARLEGRR